ncbi:endo-1,4-beta-xylanase [candidate division KSB1 bacterium]|nr:endo-1,4-beta-xylanase [candidate division KSB1 bacterium]
MKKTFILIFILPIGYNYAQDIPAGGENVLGENPLSRFTVVGSQYCIKKTVNVEGQEFDRAIQIETVTQPPLTYNLQLTANTLSSIDKNDVLLAVFCARGIQSSEETGEVRGEFVFEQNGDPWTKSTTYAFNVVADWKHFFVPFKCADTYASGAAHANFRLGYAPQIIQIGGVQLINYKKTLDIENLPKTSISYAGMESDALWRKEAAARIDQYRKGDIKIIVKTGPGLAVDNAQISVKMQKHAYKFGSAVAASRLMENSQDAKKYREVILNYYNRVVMENDLKWAPWEDTNRRTMTLEALDWLRDNDIEIRGHCLVWPGWSRMPDDLEEHKDDLAYLTTRVNEHILEEVDALKGYLVDWDVINEPYWNHDLMDLLGDDIMIDWYKTANSMDSNTHLYLNDNNIISAAGLDKTHQEHFYNTVQFLLDNNAPIHGLGTQCHFGNNVTPPVRILEILNRLAEFGLEIQTTEFDIDSQDSELQTAYTRDFMTAYFSHPATVGIIMWGFWAGQHWKPEAALYDENWNIQPHGQAWLDLVTKEWWTDETGLTNPLGEYQSRGFLGDYQFQVKYNDTTIHHTFTLTRGGITIVISGTDVVIKYGDQPVEDHTHSTKYPPQYKLYQNYPNPFNPHTTIEYAIPRKSHVTLKIYNTAGRLVKTLVDRYQQPGQYAVIWGGCDNDGEPIASGAYYYHLTGENFDARKNLIFIR